MSSPPFKGRIPRRKKWCSVARAGSNRAGGAVGSEGQDDHDHPSIVPTETKFSFRCIPVWIGTLLTVSTWDFFSHCLSPTFKANSDRYRKPSRAEVYLFSLSPLSLFKRGGVSELSDTQSIDRSQTTSFLFQFTEDTPNRDRFKKHLVPEVFSRFRN